jgi:hypothetical protein
VRPCRWIVAVTCIVACTACGDAKRLTKQEYLQRINVIASGDDARKATRLFDDVVIDPPLPRASCAARTRDFQRVLDTIVDSVEALAAPTAVAPLQRKFVAAARESIETVGHAADDVAAGKLRCGSAMNRRIYGLASTRRAEAVLREYAQRGYVFGLNSQD